MLIAATRQGGCEAALAFLTALSGLAEHRVFRDGEDSIEHAELASGSGIFMFGPDRAQTDFGRYPIAPARTGGRATASLYAVTGDVSASHDRALAAETDILLASSAEDHGASAFTLRDPGRHVRTVGDNDPMQG